MSYQQPQRGGAIDANFSALRKDEHQRRAELYAQLQWAEHIQGRALVERITDLDKTLVVMDHLER